MMVLAGLVHGRPVADCMMVASCMAMVHSKARIERMVDSRRVGLSHMRAVHNAGMAECMNSESVRLAAEVAVLFHSCMSFVGRWYQIFHASFG